MAGSSTPAPPVPLLVGMMKPTRSGKPLEPLVACATDGSRSGGAGHRPVSRKKARPVSRSRRRLKAAIDLSKVTAKVDTKDRGAIKRRPASKKVKLTTAPLGQRADLQVLAARRRPAKLASIHPAAAVLPSPPVIEPRLQREHAKPSPDLKPALKPVIEPEPEVVPVSKPPEPEPEPQQEPEPEPEPEPEVDPEAVLEQPELVPKLEPNMDPEPSLFDFLHARLPTQARNALLSSIRDRLEASGAPPLQIAAVLGEHAQSFTTLGAESSPLTGAELGEHCLAAARSQQWQTSTAGSWAALAIGEYLAQEVDFAEPAAAAVLQEAVVLALRSETAQRKDSGEGRRPLAKALTGLGLLRLRLGWGVVGGSNGSLVAAEESASLLRAGLFLHGEDASSNDGYASAHARTALSGLATATWVQGDYTRAEALAEASLLLAQLPSCNNDPFYSIQLSVQDSRTAAKVTWRSKAQLGVFLLANAKERSGAAVWLSQAAVEAEAVLGIDAEEAVRLRGLQAAGWVLCREFKRADSWLQERDPQTVEAPLVRIFV